MIHIRKEVQRVLKKGKHIVAVCGAELTGEDTLTKTALASDCDQCRQLAGVGGKNEKTWKDTVLGVRPEPMLDPHSKPLRDINGKIFVREKL